MDSPKQLGSIVPLPQSPGEAVLETVPFAAYWTGPQALKTRVEHYISRYVRLTVPEFTSLCPVTGQPDFAHHVVDYLPRERLVESKSFKLFMGSFRNHQAFHEATTDMIGMRLYEAMEPRWMRVHSFWYPRGGIPIDVFWETTGTEHGDFLTASQRAALPPVGIPAYRGR